MIEAYTKFENNNLIFDFKGEKIKNEKLELSVVNDINFKDLVEYLIKIIPLQTKINLITEEIPDSENSDKLEIIKEIIIEIFEKFNSSIDEIIQEEEEEEEEEEITEVQEESSTEDDDLPF